MKKWLIGKDVYDKSVEDAIKEVMRGGGVEWVYYRDLFLRDYDLSEYIFYGSLEMFKRLGGRLDKYRYSYYSGLIDSDYLMNPVYDIVKVKDLSITGGKFVKSDSGEKLLSGEVMDDSNFKDRVEFYKMDRLRDMDDLIVCDVKDICREWRLVICHGEVIDMTLYASTFISDKIKEADDGAADLAVKVAEGMDFDDIYVMDIGQKNDGELKVIELNCIHTSGFYDMDYAKVFGKLEEELG